MKRAERCNVCPIKGHSPRGVKAFKGIAMDKYGKVYFVTECNVCKTVLPEAIPKNSPMLRNLDLEEPGPFLDPNQYRLPTEGMLEWERRHGIDQAD